MPRPKTTPAYRLHARSGNAYTTIDGRQIQLGRHRTAESRASYDRLIAHWLMAGRTLPASTVFDQLAGPSVSVVIRAFWEHAKTYYHNAAGKPSGELENYKYVLRTLRRMYGETPAASFAGRDLRAIREAMTRPGTMPDAKTGKPVPFKGWSRNYAHQQIYRLKCVFRWASENEFVPVSVYQSLAVIKGCQGTGTKFGRS